MSAPPASTRWPLRAGSALALLAGLMILGPTAARAEDSVYDAPAVVKVQDEVETTSPRVEPGADEEPQTRPSKRRAATPPRRGGVNPCMTPDPGFGVYDRWQRGLPVGQMIAPHKGGVTKSGAFDLLVHFHGHEAARKEFVKTATGIVLVGIDLGIGSGAYSSGFASPHVFQNLITAVEAEMSRRSGKKARVRKLGLSAWSAGYGAIEMILRQPAGKKVDSVILLDSLHAGYLDESAHTLKTAQLDPFIAFAKRAAKKQTFMFMSHSSILPPGYASTTEVARYAVGELGGKPRKAKRSDVLGLDMIDRFDKGFFHMRGYTGDDKPDHCAHLGLMADIVKVHLNPRWKSPKGRR